MGYGALAGNIKGKISGLENSLANVESISFDGIWKGTAHDALMASVTDVAKKLQIEKDKIAAFTELLGSLQTYKDNKNLIITLQSQYYSIPATEENAAKRSNLMAIIQEHIAANEKLKANLQANFASFGAVGTELNLVTYSTSTSTDYLTDVDELLTAYNNAWGNADGIEGNGLTKLNDGVSIFNYYDQVDENGNVIADSGQEYVEGLIKEIQEKYSGREAAVNCALTMLQLAADKGVKLDYEHKGTMGVEPYVPTEEVASGVDCNPFTSWVVDKGVENGFQWRPVGEFKYVGETLDDWTKAQPGDVFVVSNAKDGHVGIIIENNPEEGTFICAEASAPGTGTILQTRSYSSMKNIGYQIQDMTSVYDGTENTDRPIFNQYVNWDEYEHPA